MFNTDTYVHSEFILPYETNNISCGLVVSRYTTVGDVLDQLRTRGYLPRVPSFPNITSLYMAGRFMQLQDHETMDELGIRSLSHLLLRTRLIGGGTFSMLLL